ncbi:hypothetical protein [Streptomyces lavendofoliae]|uniref:hypothetical protein n=1 Tax=Streptomyces lavendofoliae TaxID=67314 RepID=UPI003D8C75C8
MRADDHYGTVDDLMDRRLLPPEAERIANEQLYSEVESPRAAGVTAWCAGPPQARTQH